MEIIFVNENKKYEIVIKIKIKTQVQNKISVLFETQSIYRYFLDEGFAYYMFIFYFNKFLKNSCSELIIVNYLNFSQQFNEFFMIFKIYYNTSN